MSLEPFIQDLAIILGVAGLVSLLFQKIRQPVVLGYIIAGMIVGPYTPPFPLITDTSGVKVWAELGVIFLMFSLGLEFSFRKLASVGISAGFTAIIEVFLMIFLGFTCGKLLHWPSMDSFFLGAMLSISSTTVIIKALEELQFKKHRFAEIIFAILIVEDLFAILILVGLSNMALHHEFSGFSLFVAAYKLVLVVGSWFLMGYFLIPGFIRYVGSVGNREMLTIVSLGLCLGLVVFSAYFDYSVALGAFIMGSILAESVESRRIEERMESLRDLFAAIFFVSVGMLINPQSIFMQIGPILLITGVTIFGKILSTTIGAFSTGQSLKTSIQVGFGIAQIGEFSFIIAGLGTSLGVLTEDLYGIGVAVSLITTFSTPYLIRMSEQMAIQIESRLPSQLKTLLSHYGRWMLKQQTDVQRSNVFYKKLFKWGINGLVLSVLFILSKAFFLPWMQGLWVHPFWPTVATWLMTVFVSTPCIWAMLSIFKSNTKNEARRLFIHAPVAGIHVISQLFALFWLGTLSLEFFETQIVIFMVAVLGILILTVFYKKIETTYRWFEKRFFSAFENTVEPTFSHLAPWDAHLVRFQIHPNALLAGKCIAETKLRTDHGVSVVVIQRGARILVAPASTEFLLPQDELLILGNDEQLDAVRSLIEHPSEPQKAGSNLSSYALRLIFINAHSPMVFQTIRETKIRETCGAMVVGIERGNTRTMNPESTEKLQPGDTLWIVGETFKLDQLEEALCPPKNPGYAGT
jgi:CPA2 family monovalent cation:H+ antiporter-2